jgi:pyridoxamine 5'-phosphate oxidase
MTPALLKDRDGAIYALTSNNFEKRKQLESSQQVQWMFQSKALDRMATVNGRVNLIENASMRSEVIEEIGGKLGVFWKINSDPSSLVVIETIPEEGKLFLPMKGVTRSISF